MPRTKRWVGREDFDAYVTDLEDCYGIQIHLSFRPKNNGEGNEQYLHMAAWWRGEDQTKTPPVCSGVYIVTSTPTPRLVATLLAAASRFTYMALEAHCEALTICDLRRN